MPQNKMKFSFSVVLIVWLCGVNVFSQNSFTKNDKLIWKSISLEGSKFSLVEQEEKKEPNRLFPVYTEEKEENRFLSLNEDFGKLMEILFEFSSERGSFDFDVESNTLIVTDKAKRIELIENFIKILEESSFTIEELFSRRTDETGLYKTEIQIHNLDGTISCGSGWEKISWQKQQWIILFPVIQKLLSSKGTLEVDGRKKVLIVEDNWNRLLLVRQIVELFDKKFLEDVPARKPDITYLEDGTKIINHPLPAEKIHTASYKLKSILACPKDKQTFYLRNLKNIVTRRLSSSGNVEIDEFSNTIIIADSISNLKALKKLLFYLDTDKTCKIADIN